MSTVSNELHFPTGTGSLRRNHDQQSGAFDEHRHIISPAVIVRSHPSGAHLLARLTDGNQLAQPLNQQYYHSLQIRRRRFVPPHKVMRHNGEYPQKTPTRIFQRHLTGCEEWSQINNVIIPARAQRFTLAQVSKDLCREDVPTSLNKMFVQLGDRSADGCNGHSECTYLQRNEKLASYSRSIPDARAEEVYY